MVKAVADRTARLSLIEAAEARREDGTIPNQPGAMDTIPNQPEATDTIPNQAEAPVEE